MGMSTYVSTEDRAEIRELVEVIRAERDIVEADYRLIASTVFLPVSAVRVEVAKILGEDD